MANLAEVKPKLASYQPELASIKLLEQAYINNDYSLIEQVKNEESTRFAEIIDGPIRTKFRFRNTPDGLVSHGGTKLLDLWQNSYELTKNKIKDDDRQEALLVFRKLEHQEGLEVENLANNGQEGGGFLVISPYPNDIELLYGKDFLNKEGFNSSRKLAFIRQYQKVGNSIELTTISVDNSELELWGKLLGKQFNRSSELLSLRLPLGFSDIESLVNSYDTLLQRKTGKVHQQGRSRDTNIETYSFVKNQQDLLDYNFRFLQEIALSDFSEQEKLRKKIQLTASVASALIYRYESKNPTTAPNLQIELQNASQKAKADGVVYISCGGYLSLSENALLKTVTRSANSMKCVTCPFCKKTVDAIMGNNSITCPKCYVAVNTKTNKVTRKAESTLSFTKIVEQILQELFKTSKT